jgi:hypothetical protein
LAKKLNIGFLIFSTFLIVSGVLTMITNGKSQNLKDSKVFITLHSNDPAIFTNFLIDKNYLERPSLESLGQENEFFILEMTYPEMRPLSPAERTKDFSIFPSLAQKTLRESGRYLRIELHQGRIYGTEKTIKDQTETNWILEKEDPEYPDFLIYSSKIMKKVEKNGYPIITRYYIPKNNLSNQKIYIECSTNNRISKNQIICESSTNFDNYLYGSYSFSKSHLNEWAKIDNVVREFVAGIMVGGVKK